MDFPIEPKKLSLLAAYDDLMRAHQAIYESVDENFSGSIKLANDYEKLRRKYFNALQELSLEKSEKEQLRGKLHLSNTHLATVRQAYTREISKYDTLMKDYKVLAKKVAAVQEVLNDESSGRHHHLDSHKSVLSILSDLKDLNHDFSFHNDSNHFDDDGLNFDKTEDSINASLDRQISVICHNHNTKHGKGDNNANNNNNIRRPYPSEISPTSNSSADSRNQQSSGTADSSSTHSDDRDSENCVTSAKTPSKNTYVKYVTSSPSLRSSAAVPPETIENRRRLLRSASCKKIKLDLTRLDSRPHGQLQPKKIFKPNIICAPCGKTIGFCSKALVCADCHSVCHPSCASQLTLPCIPHYTPKAVKSAAGVIGGGGGVHRKIVVSDFIDQSVRPFVPAILVHLCTEIERRGLGEEGLYRKCGSDREIRELKAKFLTSKTGPPSTRHLDIHVLCGVVKNFLRELDDPLVTRVLWHDFVRASDLTVHSQEKSNELLKRSIDLLPEPNRDTLAYLILHLHKVTDACLETKMTITSLSKIFGPTVVGSSSSSSTSTTSSSGVIAENVKQNLTMQALLSLPTAYWEELLQGADVFKTPAGQMSASFRVSAATTGGKMSSMANFQSPLSYLSSSSSIYATPAALGRVARYAPVKPVNLFGTDPIY